MNINRNLLRPLYLSCILYFPSMLYAAFDDAAFDDAALKQLRVAVVQRNVNQTQAEEIADKLQDLVQDISKEILSAKSIDMGHPSPQRIDVINQVQAFLTPYNQALIGGALELKGGMYSSVRVQSRSLLNYTAPDSVLLNQAREYLKSGNTQYSLAAADILYELHALAPEDRAFLANEGQSIKADADRTDWAIFLASLGMDDGLPVFIKLLEKPFNAEGVIGSTGVPGTNPSYDAYGPALLGAQYLGKRAAPLLPYLKERLREIEGSNLGAAGQPLIRGFQGVIDTVTGKRAIQRRSAMNGTSWLDEPLQIDLNSGSRKEVVKSVSNQSVSSGDSSKRSESQSRASTQLALWLFGAIMLVIIAVILARRWR